MTWVDWAIVILIAGAALMGVLHGFLRSFFSFGGMLAGLILASWNYARVAHWLLRVVRYPAVANALGFALIAVIVMILAAIIGGFLSKAVHQIGLGCLDRVAGAAFGFFQGALLVTLCILVTAAFFPREHWLEKGRLPRQFLGICHLSMRVTPAELSKRIRVGLKVLEEESPRWLHPNSTIS